MITEIVSWQLPEGMSREDTVSKYRLSVPTWYLDTPIVIDNSAKQVIDEAA